MPATLRRAPTPHPASGIRPIAVPHSSPTSHSAAAPTSRAGCSFRPRLPVRSAVVAGLLFGSVSCAGLDPADAAGVTPQDLVATVADQLAGGWSLTYTATYRLAGGATARAVHLAQPRRSAHVYPNGRLIRTETAQTRCAGGECVRTEPGAADATLPPASGMVTSESVLTLLESAAIDPGAEIEQRSTSRAGRHATCLEVRGTESFGACVTVEGALAGFTDRVGGTAIEMVLVDYTEEVDERDFATPPGAHLIDRRGR